MWQEQATCAEEDPFPAVFLLVWVEIGLGEVAQDLFMGGFLVVDTLTVRRA